MIFKVEKVIFALVFSTCKLCPYFQAHPIIVSTNQEIRQILHNLDLAERMVAWATELSKYGLQYQPRQLLKAQCLANFMTEMTPTEKERRQEELPWTLSMHHPVKCDLEQESYCNPHLGLYSSKC